MLTLYVDGARWQAHLRRVAESHPGLVPVAKGNGYGFGLSRLAEVARQLGADTVAAGTYAEVAAVSGHFDGTVQVLAPWRPAETDAVPYGDRVMHTVGRVGDLLPLARASRDRTGQEPRVVLELLTSMRRFGFTAAGLREAAGALDGLRLEGVSLHLPIGRGHLPEVERLLGTVTASGIDPGRVFVSHLTPTEANRLRASYGGVELRPRIGTELWLGDRGALTVRATVLDVHEVERGDVYGYRGRRAPRRGHLVVVSGGTAHGIGLEAPAGASTGRARAARLVRGGLDAAGLVRSPYTIAGRQRLFAEPPHMQVSMLLVPRGVEVPPVGAEVDVQVRYTTTTVDRAVTL